MELTSLGWRDLILLLVVLAAIYLVIALLNLIRVGRKRQAMAGQDRDAVGTVEPQIEAPTFEPPGEAWQGQGQGVAPPATSRAMAAYAEVAAASGTQAAFAVPPAPSPEWEEVKELFDAEPAAASLPSAQPSDGEGRAGGFGEHLAEHLVRSDMEMELQRMRDEMQRMSQELEELRAARRVSPQYAEAMELAQRGMSAQDLADRLGISLAEAELVHALSRGRQDFD